MKRNFEIRCGHLAICMPWLQGFYYKRSGYTEMLEAANEYERNIYAAPLTIRSLPRLDLAEPLVFEIIRIGISSDGGCCTDNFISIVGCSWSYSLSAYVDAAASRDAYII
jgi:hypothetical protein